LRCTDREVIDARRARSDILKNFNLAQDIECWWRSPRPHILRLHVKRPSAETKQSVLMSSYGAPFAKKFYIWQIYPKNYYLCAHLVISAQR